MGEYEKIRIPKKKIVKFEKRCKNLRKCQRVRKNPTELERESNKNRTNPKHAYKIVKIESRRKNPSESGKN